MNFVYIEPAVFVVVSFSSYPRNFLNIIISELLRIASVAKLGFPCVSHCCIGLFFLQASKYRVINYRMEN